MNMENEVRSIIEKVSSGEFDNLSNELERADFGLFYPAYVENGTVKMMKPGHIQTETDLKIAVTANGLRDPSAKTIAWMGSGGETSWSACKHPAPGRTHVNIKMDMEIAFIVVAMTILIHLKMKSQQVWTILRRLNN